MGVRDRRISKSILRAQFRRRPLKKGLFARLLAVFSIFQLPLERYQEDVFWKLRKDVWGLDEDEYRESFREGEKRGGLKSVGDLGYSGSVGLPPPTLNSRQHLANTEYVDLLYHT
mgnify:CR=1 FL=1